MVGLKEYEKAQSDYSSNLTLNRMPLASWDFYGAFLQDLNSNFLDLKQLKALTINNNWISDFDFETELQDENVIVVTDSTLKIVFASHTILKMTGYQSQEVIGESPKLFQGKATSRKTSAEIRMAIENQEPFEKTVVNYRKSGETYDCHIKGFPIFNKKGKLSHFIAFEKVA
ncbi:PAS domain S-box-containing protein [Flavobacterium arsenatis]|uniref:PAS domain S-box-containing protein n=1 Tax=Flavobacterium arsenatis TaxID=1484332 RepID=A0ABU1TMQ5_9FLAO|nr:PAS domain-containing protein [Flavobacterium arsenatis]MDR6966712.1 PAS domain S-box-containing protein [Flavobacterium arsenatis]